MFSCGGSKDKFINRSLLFWGRLCHFCSLVYKFIEYLILVTARISSFVVEKLVLFFLGSFKPFVRTRRLSDTRRLSQFKSVN